MDNPSHTAKWRFVPLGQVCHKIQDGAHNSPKQQFSVGGPGRYLYVTSKNIRNNFIDLSNISYVGQDFHDQIYPRCTPEVGDVLLTKDGANTGNVTLNTISEPFSLLSSVALIKADAALLLPEFLAYYLQSPQGLGQITGQMTGTAIKRIILKDLKAARVPLPPITEQRDIINSLDESLELIEKAHANCAMVLQRVCGVFESYRDAVFAGDTGGLRRRLGEFVSFRNGANFTKASRGQTVAIIGVKDFLDRFSTPTEDLASVTIDGDMKEEDELMAGDLLTVRSNGNVDLIGRTMLVEKRLPNTIHSGFTIRTRLITDDVWPRYLCHFMRSRATRKRLTEGGTGTNIKSLNQGALANLACPLPPITQQKLLANRLDRFADATELLQAVYEEKLSLLDGLKQSLLHKAFSGQLHQRQSKAAVIPFPIKLQNISSTDLHIGVLAVAYATHETFHRASDFGHVKAEKIAHMVEAYVGVDLGRAPVRDAAGPNDFPHLKKVEHRADKAGYLTFARQPSGAYRVTKKAGFDSLVAKTRTALGYRNQDLDKLLNLMTPMTTKQAEIFATVYAAWNNLLMDGEPITDERIVYAAREDWHSDKLNIPRDKFFAAIEWIRTKGICPEGKGKRVEAKKH